MNKNGNKARWLHEKERNVKKMKQKEVAILYTTCIII
jgi:hypothetical protein